MDQAQAEAQPWVIYIRSESDGAIKTANQNIFWLIYKKFYRKKFVIKNIL